MAMVSFKPYNGSVVDMKEKILQLLAEKEMTVTELANALGISKATVSHHIENLQREGLVRVAREERVKNFIRKYYTLAIPNENVGEMLVNAIRLSASKRDRVEVFRNTVRLLGFAMLKVSPHLFKRIGFEVGYALGFKDASLDDLAELWESLGLGETSCSRDTLVVENCYFCSGLPNVGYTYCKFDEGFIAGFLVKSANQSFSVEETKCWGLGYEFCEFNVKKI